MMLGQVQPDSEVEGQWSVLGKRGGTVLTTRYLITPQVHGYLSLEMVCSVRGWKKKRRTS